MSGLVEYVVFVLLLAIFLTAFAVAVGALLLGRTRKVAAVLERHARRSIWVGALNLVFGVAISLPFFALQGATGADAWALPGLAVLVVLVILVGLGFAGVSLWAGTRLAPEAGLVRRLALGAASLAVGAGLPVAGTFLLLPLVLTLSLGALLLSFLIRVPDTRPGLV